MGSVQRRSLTTHALREAQGRPAVRQWELQEVRESPSAGCWALTTPTNAWRVACLPVRYSEACLRGLSRCPDRGLNGVRKRNTKVSARSLAFSGGEVQGRTDTLPR